MWREEHSSEEYVYGVMFDDRQRQVARCRVNDPLEFIREPSNRVDPLAVKILVRGRHVGYFKEELAERYADGMDGGVIRFGGSITAIEPFTRDRKKWLGIRFELHRFRFEEPPEVVAARAAEQKATRAQERKLAKRLGLTMKQYDALPTLNADDSLPKLQVDAEPDWRPDEKTGTPKWMTAHEPPEDQFPWLNEGH